MRVGFLGTGWIGRHRMQAMIETGAIEAVAYADPSDEMAAEAAQLAPRGKRVDGLDGLLNEGLDGIVIATPSALHAEQSIRALDSGVAVFCQKPLGRTAAEVRAVVEAARNADRLLGLDLSYRHTEAMRRIRALVQGGELGRVSAVDLVFHNAYGPGKSWFFDPAQSGGGCVIDLGVHLVDLALWALDFPDVADVQARLLAKGRPLGPGECEDYAVATLTLADGRVITLACSWNLPAGRDAIITASFYGEGQGAGFRNENGSFFDFTAERWRGTATEVLASPPDDWGGRAAADWARRLAAGERFSADAERFVDVADVLDRIYGR
ncbi:putative oxidoreductase [Sphingomonas changbaiensis NBRC 104936]|uniref:Putative oxidoreductase n=1 Tax=Sphingomonas changbaiensis NBRC 104936 TaxID=1219043 RepID=A0A0E9MS04_9SPHN|nr:Gfo/Idh/MocA family oxidoreductase [Sphingomonas changbaiensis]GAO40273.1 putative oxidoreductase [Sphingomonas changbaiensis NBRC 104936]